MTASEGHGPPASHPEAALSQAIKAHALGLGFDAIGIAPALTPPGYPRLLEWLASGRGGGLEYLERQAPARAHPARLLEGARSVIVGLISYHPGQPHASTPRGDQPAAATSGRVARYARGKDYHPLFWDRLGQLLAWLRERRPGIQGRAVCDSAPLMERDFARLAGLGWLAKNTMLIHPRLGSYTLLGALIVDLELVYDQPLATPHCGTCTRCLHACPTQAFPEPGVLDAGRCVSTWTIERRGPLDDDAAASLAGWVFGCDICQEVCPWNRKAPQAQTAELAPDPALAAPDLAAWIRETPERLRRQIKGTALERARRRGLVRNALLVLGSRRDVSLAPLLIASLADPEPLVRGAAAWAVGGLPPDIAAPALLEAQGKEEDPAVLSAIGRALFRLRSEDETLP